MVSDENWDKDAKKLIQENQSINDSSTSHSSGMSTDIINAFGTHPEYFTEIRKSANPESRKNNTDKKHK